MKLQERLRADGYGPDVEPVLFYYEAGTYGEFSNFSKHPIWLPSPFDAQEHLHYFTGEHRFQAMKATTPEAHELVRLAPGPLVAKKLGRSIVLREGWGDNYSDLCWYVMLETVRAKAHFHPDVAKLLLLTGDRPIYEDSPTDDIWGWRYRESYGGKNLLGRAWMQVRSELTKSVP